MQQFEQDLVNFPFQSINQSVNQFSNILEGA